MKDKMYLYVKDPFKLKYYYLVDKREKTGIEHWNNSNLLLY